MKGSQESRLSGRDLGTGKLPELRLLSWKLELLAGGPQAGT